MEPARPFKRLSVESHFNYLTKQVVLVAWVMNPAFDQPGPYTFTLQRGRSPNDDQWEDVSTTVDQPWLYDNHPVFGQMDRSTYYRVVLRDGRKQEYTSQPISRDDSWNHNDWRLAREIIRKETLVLTKKGGTRGWLLKRRAWGDPCPKCVDKNTGSVKDAHCLTCFGTGVIGGYYPALEYYVSMNPTQRLRKIGPEGLETAVMETVRALAWPSPEANDVWVQANSNRRYRVEGDIVANARHRGVDLILDLHLLELPLSSIVFQVPTP